MRVVLAALALLAFAPIQTEDTRAAATFLADLQRHVARNDRAAVAAMIQFPINVRGGSIQIPFQNAAEFIKGYDLVFTAALKEAVAQTKMPGDTRKARFTLGINAQGVLIGNGVIYAEASGGSYTITRIALVVDSSPGSTNQPAASAPAAASKASGATPQRLTPGGRTRMAQGSGTLERGAMRSYVVFAGQGQMLDVRLDGVRGREIVVKVFNAKTRAPVDARAGEGVRRWTGRVAASSDYRIDVVHTSTASEALRYLLLVTVQ